jgi:Flp pilus assembly protein TadD
LQTLWLRATHAAGHVEEGWAWVKARRDAGDLAAAAHGVASLLAVDADDFASAKALADTALANHPDQLEALVARATVALAERDGFAAKEWLARAQQQNPDDGRTWSMLGLASLQAQQLPLAQSQLERAVALMPGHIGSWHALGWACLLQGEYSDARKAFVEALALDGNFSESHGAIGLVLALQGEGAQAERHLSIADRLDPRNVSARFARALLRGETADPDRLRALVSQLLDRPGPLGGRLADGVLPAIRTPRN